MIKTHDEIALMVILQVYGTLSHVVCQIVIQKGAFYRVVCRSFPQSVISEIHWLLPLSFFLQNV